MAGSINLGINGIPLRAPMDKINMAPVLILMPLENPSLGKLMMDRLCPLAVRLNLMGMASVLAKTSLDGL